LHHFIWIHDDEVEEALQNPFINNRISQVKEFRRLSKKTATQRLADKPHKFGEIRVGESDFIMIPTHSSENRNYIPMGFMSQDVIITNSAQAIYDTSPYILGVITSKMHMIWVNTVGGKLKLDYRYSSQLCYNTFPFPIVSKQQKTEIIDCVFSILQEREKHPEKTLAQLYDPNKMPDGLREAHHQNDLAVEKCYRDKPFKSDEERLSYLFKLYEEMIAEEKANNPVPKKKKKTPKKKASA